MFEQQRVQGMVVLHNVIGIADVSMTGRGGLLRDSMGRRWCCAVDHITGGGGWHRIKVPLSVPLNAG